MGHQLAQQAGHQAEAHHQEADLEARQEAAHHRARPSRRFWTSSSRLPSPCFTPLSPTACWTRARTCASCGCALCSPRRVSFMMMSRRSSSQRRRNGSSRQQWHPSGRERLRDTSKGHCPTPVARLRSHRAASAQVLVVDTLRSRSHAICRPVLPKLEWIKQRTEFIDRVLDEFVASLPDGERAQAVLIGSGYDTRCAAHGLRWWLSSWRSEWWLSCSR